MSRTRRRRASSKNDSRSIRGSRSARVAENRCDALAARGWSGIIGRRQAAIRRERLPHFSAAALGIEARNVADLNSFSRLRRQHELAVPFFLHRALSARKNQAAHRALAAKRVPI